ncbi:MAG: addiction module protein [Bacteroides sp. SM23_62_1]|nr:MAG: addiction module protein [Bacteroides sp. SM23_62_1]
MFDPEKPYNDLPDLPPAVNIETRAILKRVIAASRALSELKGAINRLPNPHLFLDTINLQEAQASTAIENIITTQDELFRASVADKKIENQATKEAMYYKDAIWYAIDALKREPFLTTNLFIDIAGIIKKNTAGIRNVPGTQLKNPVTGQIYYTPPEGELVIREKLANLEQFIHAKDDIDPLIKLALIHYQFEAIHPFFDGNGRTGRIIVLLYLILQGLLDLPVLYFSKYIIARKESYYKCLQGVTESHDWFSWIEYVLDMIEKTSYEGKITLEEIDQLMIEFGEEIQEKIPKVYSGDLIDTLFRLPYTKRNDLVKAGIGNLKTSGNYLHELEFAGFLKSEKVGKEKLYIIFRLMSVLQKR